MQLCVVGDSISREAKASVVVVACQKIEDCYAHSKSLPCDRILLSCIDGYCVCNV